MLFSAFGLFVSGSVHAHLLNMTKADLRVLPDERALLVLEIDLSRSMDSPYAYYNLSKRLDHSDYEKLWQKIGDGIELRNNNIGVPLHFLGASQTSEYFLEDFQDPLIWPRIGVTFASEPGSITAGYALMLTFTRDFFFEEPIALAMRSEEDDISINRWLVTDQDSPLFTDQKRVLLRKAPLDFTDLLTMMGFGFSHVIPNGLDHLLFLLGLSFFIKSTKKLVLTITIFTVAHTIALLVASYRIVEIPPIVIEPFILATIAWMGLKLYRYDQSDVAISSIFLFGLVHGLGFATAFREFAITDNVIGQLVAFNIGVELAQIAFVVPSAVVAFKLQTKSRWQDSVAHFTGGALLASSTIWIAYLLSSN